MEELKKRHAGWCQSLQRAVETDGWGQVIEAVEAYERYVSCRVLKYVSIQWRLQP